MINCPLCKRDADDTMSDHHLIPKCKKGKETVSIHQVCHDAIHSNIPNNSLVSDYNTIEKLLNHPAIIKYIKWIKNKPANFYIKTKLNKHG